MSLMLPPGLTTAAVCSAPEDSRTLQNNVTRLLSSSGASELVNPWRRTPSPPVRIFFLFSFFFFFFSFFFFRGARAAPFWPTPHPTAELVLRLLPRGLAGTGSSESRSQQQRRASSLLPQHGRSEQSGEFGRTGATHDSGSGTSSGTRYPSMYCETLRKFRTSATATVCADLDSTSQEYDVRVYYLQLLRDKWMILLL